MPRATSCPDPDEITIWHADAGDVFASAAARAQALDWLTPAERVRHERYRHDRDRDMFLLGRAMARAVVGDTLGIAPTAWTWREGERGRPEVDQPVCPVSFNLAHSGGLVVCALAHGASVGVDVEDRARAALDRNLVARYCSPAERADIDALGETGWQDRFLQYWTLKEAYLKARGLGIALPLSDLSFAVADGEARLTFERSLAGADPAWAFTLAPLGQRHYVAVAASTANGARPRFTLKPMASDFLR